jgi:hypothetical protein
VAIREYKRATKCALGGRLRRCRRPLVGQCQYCARGFCESHGDQFGKGEEVCHRSSCQAKKQDLETYNQFKLDAAARNDTNLCGIATCDQTPRTDCERCTSHFCIEHLRQHVIEIVKGVEHVPEVVRICVHCVERISLWEKV